MKLTPEEITKVRAALATYQRPCEYGECKYKKNGNCVSFECVPENTEIKKALGRD